MKQQLDSRLRELEATVDALTDEIVELRQRLDEIEGKTGERQEIGVDMDAEEEEDEDDIYVA